MILSINLVIFEEFCSYSKSMISHIHTILEKSSYNDIKCRELTGKFVYQFPMHDFVIDKNMEADIGLHAEFFDVDVEEWDIVRN